MKMTQRDKLLLVVLAIVFVVAIVIVAPEFGVMDCNEKLETTESNIATINSELASQLAELRTMGVSEIDADNYTRANYNLKTKIDNKKEEAARLVDVIFAKTENWDVDEQWLKPLKYYESLLSGEEILDYNELTNEGVSKSQDDETKTFVVDNAEYTLPVVTRRVSFSDTEPTLGRLELTYPLEDYSDADVGSLILYLRQLEAKGSIQITGFSYDVKAGTGSVEFTVLMTANSDLANYAGDLDREKEAAENGEEEEDE